MIPVYSFMQGDTLGLLVLLQEDQTIRQVVEQVQASSSLRAAPLQAPQVLWRGEALAPEQTVRAAGIQALDRIDVREAGA